MGLKSWLSIFAVCAVALAAVVVPTLRSNAPPDPRTTITWLVPMQLDRPLLEELRDQFNLENPDINLHFVFVPGAQYQTKLKTLIAAGHPPDMFYCGDVWVAYYRPFLLDLTPYFERDAAEIGMDDIYPAVLAACRTDGKYLFIPRWFSVALLYYNVGRFDEVNEPYPTPNWTWTEYIAAGKRLTQKNDAGQVEVWGSQIVTGWWGEWLTLVRQAGGELFDKKMKRCLLDSPEAMAGMQFYIDKVRVHKISPPPGFGPDQGFASGKLAMELVGHTGNWTQYNQIKGLNWDIALLPAGPTPKNRSEVAIEAIGASKETKHPEACWRFFKFMMRKSTIRAHVDRGYLSIRKSVANETHLTGTFLAHPKHAEVAYVALQLADHGAHSPDFIEIALDVIQPEIDRALAARPDADEAKRQAAVAEACRRAAKAANDFIEALGTERRADASGVEAKK